MNKEKEQLEMNTNFTMSTEYKKLLAKTLHEVCVFYMETVIPLMMERLADDSECDFKKMVEIYTDNDCDNNELYYVGVEVRYGKGECKNFSMSDIHFTSTEEAIAIGKQVVKMFKGNSIISDDVFDDTENLDNLF